MRDEMAVEMAREAYTDIIHEFPALEDASRALKLRRYKYFSLAFWEIVPNNIIGERRNGS